MGIVHTDISDLFGVHFYAIVGKKDNRIDYYESQIRRIDALQPTKRLRVGMIDNDILFQFLEAKYSLGKPDDVIVRNL